MSHTSGDFDVEYNACYLDSYTDVVMSGSLAFMVGKTLVTGSRTRVASLVSGSDEVYGTTRLGEFLILQANPTKNLGMSFRFTSGISTQVCYDSLVPDAIGITKTNNGLIVEAFVEGVPYGVVADANNFDMGKIILATSGCSAIFSSLPDTISDNYWLTSFPFQARYRAISRRERDYASYQGMTDGVFEQLTGLVITRNPVNAIMTRGLTLEFTGTILCGTASNASNNRLTLFDRTGSVANVPPNPANFSVNLVKPGQGGFIQPTTSDFLKSYFGFGDFGPPDFFFISGAVNDPLAGTGLLTDHLFNQNYYHGYGPQIRGWKYGLMNAAPTSMRSIFRRNRFGQLRDTLEQRPYTKTVLPDNKTISSPLLITFVSASQAFLTASNPSTLNARDSGIYDYEYKSGQPWNDRDV